MTHPPTPVILLVEDEVFIRLVTADALSDGGFMVLEAQDAHEALRILGETPHVDLLFTDINLPGNVDGIELSRLVEERRPGTRLVVTSGRQHLRDSDLPDDGVFLPKPYRADQVCHVIRTQLAR